MDNPDSSGFSYSLIREAHEKARQYDMKEITDDSMLVERYGKVPVCLVEGAYENLKITTPEDILVAEKILEKILEKS